MQAHRGRRGIAILFLNLGTRWRWVINARPGRFTPGKEPRIAIVEATGWAPGLVWACIDRRKPLFPPGFEPRTAQPEANRYSDYTFFLNNQPDALIISILFCYKTLRVSAIFSAHHQQFSTVHSALVSFMQVSDDEQRRCPKHVVL
jgi:hypothetical protein